MAEIYEKVKDIEQRLGIKLSPAAYATLQDIVSGKMYEKKKARWDLSTCDGVVKAFKDISRQTFDTKQRVVEVVHVVKESKLIIPQIAEQVINHLSVITNDNRDNLSIITDDNRDNNSLLRRFYNGGAHITIPMNVEFTSGPVVKSVQAVVALRDYRVATSISTDCSMLANIVYIAALKNTHSDTVPTIRNIYENRLCDGLALDYITLYEFYSIDEDDEDGMYHAIRAEFIEQQQGLVRTREVAQFAILTE